jgi:hypothetical protein
MAKAKNRLRQQVTVTLDPGVLKIAKSIGAAKVPPYTLSRLLDEAMAEWSIKHGPKGRGAK